jgi:hypothetical protein
VKNASQKTFASWMDPNSPGNAGQYFRVLKADSEYGLSSDTCGLEWDCAMFSFTYRPATVLLVIEVPRSACTASGAMPSLAAMACSMNSFASSPVSVGQTSQWMTFLE